MKVVLKLPIGKNGAMILLRCGQCGQPVVFRSFRAALEYAAVYKNLKATIEQRLRWKARAIRKGT